MTATTLTNQQLADMTPHDIAKAFGCGYDGDVNPLDHGGFFYDYRDWEANGYANVVEFWHDDENGCLVVQPGTVSKPADMAPAFRCIGMKASDNVHAQIDAARSYCGIEPDGTHYPDLKNFKLENWKERNIWGSVRGWIESLGA